MKNEKGRESSLIIGFVGLTHLGLNHALASAAKGYQVVGFSDDSSQVENLRSGELGLVEPGLSEARIKYSELISFTDDPRELHQCDLVYISLDVPTTESGASDLAEVKKFIHLATKAMRVDAVLIILCQVSPGFTRDISWPATQLYYQVETLVFGKAYDRALNPERLIVGAASLDQILDVRLGEYLASFQAPIFSMDYESAELAKVAINMCLIAHVSVANTMAEICEKIGASWDRIIPALKLDRRIGEYSYIKPGLGISGGNLERDIATVIGLGHMHLTHVDVVEAFKESSDYCRDWALRAMRDFGIVVSGKKRIAILGLSYKENTSSIKNSASLRLLPELRGNEVVVYDPAARCTLDEHPFVKRVNSVEEALRGADVLAIMTPWEEFYGLKPQFLRERMSGNKVLDPYRIIDWDRSKDHGFSVASLGRKKENF